MTNGRVLVVGGAGYIGSQVVRDLMVAGYTVTILDECIYDNEFALETILMNPKILFIKTKMDNKKVLRDLMCSHDVVIQLAGLVGDPICNRYPDLARAWNLEDTIDSVMLAHNSSIKKFIFASSCSVYGKNDSTMMSTESSPLNPLSDYARSKAVVDEFLRSLYKYKQIDYTPVVLRLGTVYGISPRMRFDLSVNEFTRDIARGKELEVYDPDTWRPYVHVQDVSNVIVECVNKDVPVVMNVASQNMTKRGIVEAISKHCDISKVSYRNNGDDLRDYKASSQLLTDSLRYKFTESVEDGIEEVLLGVKANLWNDGRQYGDYQI